MLCIVASAFRRVRTATERCRRPLAFRELGGHDVHGPGHTAGVLFHRTGLTQGRPRSLYAKEELLFRPHRSTTHVDAAYCYRPSSVVCRSVCRSVCHTSEPCKNGCTDRDAVWVEDSGGPKEPCRLLHGVQIPHGKRQFCAGKGRPIVKYRDTLRSSVQKRLNRSRCCLACGLGLGWAVGIMCYRGPEMPRDVAMATTVWLSMGYNFGCMIASDTLFDSMCGFSESSYPMKT